MTIRTPRILARATGVLASVALVATGITALAPASQAAVGDITSYSTPLPAVDVTTTANGTAWALSSNATTTRLTRIAPDGAQVTLDLDGFSQSLTVGPDGNIWVAGRGAKAIYRIDGNLGVTTFTQGLPANADPLDITSGPDGALWFTMLATKAIGRITTDGAITSFDLGQTIPRDITAAPEAANALYFGTNGDKLGRITTSGQVSLINAQNGTVFTNDPVVAGSNIWFTESRPFLGITNDNLAKVVGDNSVAIITRNISEMTNTGPGISDTFWVASNAQKAIYQFSSQGAQVAEFPVPQGPGRVHQSASDGSVWMTAGGNQVLKMNVGVVPITTKSPAITPATGIVAGMTLTTDNGEWKYASGATYTYQWQICANSDPTSCGPTPNSNGQTFVVSQAQIGQYIRSCVTATNANGPATSAACSGPLALGSVTPEPPKPPLPATGPTAAIGNGASMVIDAPTKQKIGKKANYVVTLTVTDATGTVSYLFQWKKKQKQASVPLSGSTASYSFKLPKKWKNGKMTVTATFTPPAGSPYLAGQVKDTVKIKK